MTRARVKTSAGIIKQMSYRLVKHWQLNSSMYCNKIVKNNDLFRSNSWASTAIGALPEFVIVTHVEQLDWKGSTALLPWWWHIGPHVVQVVALHRRTKHAHRHTHKAIQYIQMHLSRCETSQNHRYAYSVRARRIPQCRESYRWARKTE